MRKFNSNFRRDLANLVTLWITGKEGWREVLSALNTFTGVSNTVCTAASYVRVFVVRVFRPALPHTCSCGTNVLLREHAVLGVDTSVVSDAISTQAVCILCANVIVRSSIPVDLL